MTDMDWFILGCSIGAGVIIMGIALWLILS